MSNSVAGNAVISYRRGPDGLLTYDREYAIGASIEFSPSPSRRLELRVLRRSRRPLAPFRSASALPDNRFVVTNATAAGRLALLDPSGMRASTTGGPTDVAVSKSGPQFLYVLNSGAGAIDIFRIRADGSLETSRVQLVCPRVRTAAAC